MSCCSSSQVNDGEHTPENIPDMLTTQKGTTICGHEVEWLTPKKVIILKYAIPTALIALAILSLIGAQLGFFELAQQWLSSGGLSNWQVVVITVGTGVGFIALIGLIKFAINHCSKKPHESNVLVPQQDPVIKTPVVDLLHKENILPPGASLLAGHPDNTPINLI